MSLQESWENVEGSCGEGGEMNKETGGVEKMLLWTRERLSCWFLEIDMDYLKNVQANRFGTDTQAFDFVYLCFREEIWGFCK